MSHSFHPEGPLLCGAVKSVNDLKRWEICGGLSNRQTMSKTTQNDEGLTGQLGEYGLCAIISTCGCHLKASPNMLGSSLAGRLSEQMYTPYTCHM